MPTITIPKELAKKDDLVILPRKEYEGLLRRAKNQNIEKLERGLLKALQELREGKIVGPFKSVKLLKESLEK